MAAELVYVFAAGLLGPIYAIFVQNIGGDILDAATAYAIFTGTIGLAAIVTGRIQQGVRNKRALLISGYGLLACGFAGYLFVTNPFQLFVVQAVLGLGWAWATPAWDSLFARSMDHKREIAGWGSFEGVQKLSQAGSAMAGGLIATIFGFHTLFIGMTAFAIISVIIIASVKEIN